MHVIGQGVAGKQAGVAHQGVGIAHIPGLVGFEEDPVGRLWGQCGLHGHAAQQQGRHAGTPQRVKVRQVIIHGKSRVQAL